MNPIKMIVLLVLLWIQAPGVFAYADELTAAEFIQFAATKSNAEVAAAKLALNSSCSGEVKAYAQRVMAEQSEILSALETLAQQEGIAMNAAATSGAYVFIRKGETFDTAYANKRAQELKRLVKVVRKAMTSTNPELRHYAENTLPLLMHHWYQAQHLVVAVNKPAIQTDSMVATR